MNEKKCKHLHNGNGVKHELHDLSNVPIHDLLHDFPSTITIMVPVMIDMNEMNEGTNGFYKEKNKSENM